MKTDHPTDRRGQFIALIEKTVASLPRSLPSSDQYQPASIEQKDENESAWRLVFGSVEVLLLHNRAHSPANFRAFFCIGRPSPERLKLLLRSLLVSNFNLGARSLSGYCLDADGNIHFSESFALDSTSPGDLIAAIEARHVSALLLQDEFEAHCEPARRP
ncbi:hypothetical protein VARIO8X_90148 [Burkholderiales bacterium 8X]|nr:hypothetical protein VARIO8X_90148 [Burkholderiales bacterium 8X]